MRNQLLVRCLPDCDRQVAAQCREFGSVQRECHSPDMRGENLSPIVCGHPGWRGYLPIRSWTSQLDSVLRITERQHVSVRCDRCSDQVRARDWLLDHLLQRCCIPNAEGSIGMGCDAVSTIRRERPVSSDCRPGILDAGKESDGVWFSLGSYLPKLHRVVFVTAG